MTRTALTAALLLAPSLAHAQYLSTITLDGSSSDWAGLYHFNDPAEGDVQDGRDISTVYVANDSTYLYFAVETYAALNAGRDLKICLSNGRCAVLTLNGAQKCQGLTVQDTSGNVLTDLGCGSASDPNSASSGTFIETRVSLAALGLTSAVNVSLQLEFIPASGSVDAAPSGGSIVYDNTGTLAPTFINVVDLSATATAQGVWVRWRTSAEWLSAGTWVVRAAKGGWEPVVSAPSGAHDAPAGGAYEVLDARGRAGDRYALMEIDAADETTLVGPVVARPGAAPPPRAAAHTSPRRRGPPALRPGRHGLVQELKVEVEREGVYVVCDAAVSELRKHAVATGVRLRGAAVASYRVGEPLAACAGLAFYAPAPAGPHDGRDVYRVSLGRASDAPALGEPSVAPCGGVEMHSAPQRFALMQRKFIDMRDGAPNRFFWGFVSPLAQPTVALPGGLSAGSSVSLSLQARANVAGEHLLHVTSGGQVIASAPFSKRGWTRLDFESLALPSAGPLSFAVAAGAPRTEVIFLADAELRAAAPLSPVDGRLAFESESAGCYVTDASYGVALDVTEAQRAVPAAASYASSGQLVVAVPAAGRRVFVSESIDALAPAAVEADERLTSPSTAAEYLVLAPEQLRDALEPLAELRAASGLSAEIVSYEAVYDLFSASNPDPRAIAALLDWAEQTWRVPPRYLVLAGSATYDPYGYSPTALAADAPIGTIQLPVIDYRAWSDVALVSPDSGAAYTRDLAVGRIPSSDFLEVAAYVAKVAAHEAQAAGRGGATMVNGPRGARDPSFVELAAAIGGAFSGDVALLDDPATDALVARWPRSDVVAYLGHGSVGAWSYTMLAGDHLSSLTAARPPLTMSVACMDGSYLAGNGGLAWTLMRGARGTGSIAAVAPSSLTDPQQAARFLETMAKADAHRWGDAWAAAQRHWTSGPARSMVFLGDPALTIPR